jgi:hypothetical protein
MLAVAVSSAQAITYSATDIRDTPSVFSTNGSFSTKDGWQSVGVGGRTGGEIDISETITGSFGSPVTVDRIQLKFLYDGPEFGDVQETATFKVGFADSTTSTYSFTALFGSAPSGSVSGMYSFAEGLNAVALTASVDNSAQGAWSLLNPFGNRAVNSVVFSAAQGVCGSGLRCSNQSDYAVRSISVSPIPEPSTYALMLAGLIAVGFMSRRRTRG